MFNGLNRAHSPDANGVKLEPGLSSACSISIVLRSFSSKAAASSCSTSSISAMPLMTEGSEASTRHRRQNVGTYVGWQVDWVHGGRARTRFLALNAEGGVWLPCHPGFSRGVGVFALPPDVVLALPVRGRARTMEGVRLLVVQRIGSTVSTTPTAAPLRARSASARGRVRLSHQP